LRKELRGINRFFEQIDNVIKLALSPAWFNRFIASHPDAQIQIRFVEGSSLSDKGLQNLSRDLTKLGKSDILQKIVDAKSQVVFIELNNHKQTTEPRIYSRSFWATWSRWIVMPNREMVLWEFEGDNVGNWSEKDFKTMDCYGWKCTGAVISEGGEILNP
jgi:hypothetical protein